MGVSEGHAGSGARQAAGTAAAGIQGRGLVLASAPDTVRHAAVPAEPHAETHRGPRSARAPRLRARGLRAPPRGLSGNCRPLVPPLRDSGPSPGSSFPPRGIRVAVPRAHSPHCPRPRHSQAHRRAASSAASGSARCRPRRSKWCRRPRSSVPRRPSVGPGACTTGWGLRRLEGRGQVSATRPSH